MDNPNDPTFIIRIWTFLKENDLPNWIVVIFTAILWPLALFYWNKRKVNNVPNLEVSLAKANININGNDYEAIDLNFLNNTGSIVYLTCARVMKCSKLFPVPDDLRRDISDNSHELLFIDKDGKYNMRQITLQTDQSIKTSLAIKNQLPGSFYSYKSTCFRKLFRWRKYFILEYIAMVGSKRYRVSTIY